MRIKLDSEDGFKAIDQDESPDESEVYSPEAVSEHALSLAQQRVQDVIEAALSARIPRSRPLRPWDAQKLNARHIAMLCDKASGMSSKEIAERYKMSEVRVSAIVTHPDSIVVLSALLSLNADKQTDISARLQGYSHEMLTGKVEIFRETSDLRLKNAIATDILDRAGYGSRQQVDLNASMRFVMPLAQAAAVTQALDESNRVSAVDYRQFTGKKLGEQAQAALGSGASVSVPVSRESEPLTDDGASPEASQGSSSSPELRLALLEERESRAARRRTA